MRIDVTTLDGSPIGSVSVFGTTDMAVDAARTRAAALAARVDGRATWGIAWTHGEPGHGTVGISVSDGWNAGATIARWELVA